MTEYTSKHPINGVTASSVIFHKTESFKTLVLLITRKDNPFQDMFALPGGFVNNNETIYNAAIRELKEETSLSVNLSNILPTIDTPLIYVGVRDDIDRDPRMRVIDHIYYSVLNRFSFIEAGDDAKTVDWIDVNYLHYDNLAFDHFDSIFLAHRKAIKDGNL
jgi:8-oxo-dGTP diphosphatase